jgi:hypothetical protein
LGESFAYLNQTLADLEDINALDLQILATNIIIGA